MQSIKCWLFLKCKKLKGKKGQKGQQQIKSKRTKYFPSLWELPRDNSKQWCCMIKRKEWMRGWLKCWGIKVRKVNQPLSALTLRTILLCGRKGGRRERFWKSVKANKEGDSVEDSRLKRLEAGRVRLPSPWMAKNRGSAKLSSFTTMIPINRQTFWDLRHDETCQRCEWTNL